MAGAGRIAVNGAVAPSPNSTGVTTLELTSRDLTLKPSVLVSGVISDGTNPNSTLALRAGFETDSDNHRGMVRVTGLNTYSGPTIVNGAILEFNSIANADGTASALGAPGNVADGTRLETSIGLGSFLVEYSNATNAVILSDFLATAFTADFDGDGDVDENDLSAWQSAYATDAAGDTDSDGDSDGFDFLTWQQQYTGDLSPPVSASTVPEPSCMVLLLGLVTLGMLFRK